MNCDFEKYSNKMHICNQKMPLGYSIKEQIKVLTASVSSKLVGKS